MDFRAVFLGKTPFKIQNGTSEAQKNTILSHGGRTSYIRARANI